MPGRAGLVTTEQAYVVTHENRPVAVKSQIYEILVQCHATAAHGGRDKTSAQVRRYYSWIPKELIARFVKCCPMCNARRTNNKAYFVERPATTDDGAITTPTSAALALVSVAASAPKRKMQELIVPTDPFHSLTGHEADSTIPFHELAHAGSVATFAEYYSQYNDAQHQPLQPFPEVDGSHDGRPLTSGSSHDSPLPTPTHEGTFAQHPLQLDAHTQLQLDAHHLQYLGGTMDAPTYQEVTHDAEGWIVAQGHPEGTEGSYKKPRPPALDLSQTAPFDAHLTRTNLLDHNHLSVEGLYDYHFPAGSPLSAITMSSCGSHDTTGSEWCPPPTPADGDFPFVKQEDFELELDLYRRLETQLVDYSQSDI
jgi:hypothetical protein